MVQWFQEMFVVERVESELLFYVGSVIKFAIDPI